MKSKNILFLFLILYSSLSIGMVAAENRYLNAPAQFYAYESIFLTLNENLNLTITTEDQADLIIMDSDEFTFWDYDDPSSGSFLYYEANFTNAHFSYNCSSSYMSILVLVNTYGYENTAQAILIFTISDIPQDDGSDTGGSTDNDYTIFDEPLFYVGLGVVIVFSLAAYTASKSNKKSQEIDRRLKETPATTYIPPGQNNQQQNIQNQNISNNNFQNRNPLDINPLLSHLEKTNESMLFSRNRIVKVNSGDHLELVQKFTNNSDSPVILKKLGYSVYLHYNPTSAQGKQMEVQLRPILSQIGFSEGNRIWMEIKQNHRDMREFLPEWNQIIMFNSPIFVKKLYSEIYPVEHDDLIQPTDTVVFPITAKIPLIPQKEGTDFFVIVESVVQYLPKDFNPQLNRTDTLYASNYSHAILPIKNSDREANLKSAADYNITL